MTQGTTSWRRRVPALLGVAVAAAGMTISRPAAVHAAAPTSSSSVGLVTSPTNTTNLWTDALGLGVAVPDGGTYTNAANSASYTIHNLTLSSIDGPGATGPSTIDTLVVYALCEIGAHQNAMTAIKQFLNGGGKLIILDGANCSDNAAGNDNWSTFSLPFTANYLDPIPNNDPIVSGAGTVPSTPYNYVDTAAGSGTNTLTKGNPDCTAGADPPGCEPANATADGLQISPQSAGWCETLAGTTNNGTVAPPGPFTGVNGAFEAWNRGSNAGAPTGLVVYEGEAYTASNNTAAESQHLRRNFDGILKQPMNPDGLTCPTAGALGTFTLTPGLSNNSVGNTETLTATLLDSTGAPVAGVPVTFTWVAGLNSTHAPVTASTDATGKATASYTSSSTTVPTNKDQIVATAARSTTSTPASPNDWKSPTAIVNWGPPVSVPETKLAVFVPVIGGLVLVSILMVPVLRRRRRGMNA